MANNKPERAARHKVTIAIVATGALLIGAVAGNLGRTLIDYIQNPEVEKGANIVEIAGPPTSSQPTPIEPGNTPQAYTNNKQDSNQPENPPGGSQICVDPKIQSGLEDIENQLQRLYGELDSLNRKLDSYRKAAGTDGRRVTHTQASLRELQSDLKKLQESVKKNYQNIQKITDRRYGREFVTLSQVQSLIGSVSKVSEHEIRDIVERTLRDYRLTGRGTYGTINRTINDIRKEIDRIDRSMGDMRRDIDELKRKVD